MTKQELEQCINEYGKEVYSFCRYLAHTQQEAEDLYQDTFLRLLQLRQRVHMERNPKGYILSVALSIWKNRRRKAAWRERIAPMTTYTEGQDAVWEAEAISPESSYIEQEEQKIVRRLVYELPEKLKLCVLLYYMEELSVSEIAHSLRIPEGTVKSRLYQARRQLEKDLEEVLDEKRYG